MQNCGKTPYYVIDEGLLIKNLEILRYVKQKSGCKILLAQKAFSCYYFYPLIAEYLDGTCASGLFEARLSHEHFGKENHVFSPAHREDEIEEIAKYATHIVFNSMEQFTIHNSQFTMTDKGLRINPEISTQPNNPLYDPCAKYSRMGVRAKDIKNLDGIDGLHFHTLCEQNVDALEVTLRQVEANFSHLFGQIKWLNFGGGHHITRADYDVERLISLILEFKRKYGLEVYLEPGEAVVLNAGFLVSSVLDIVENDKKIAILDTSAACHMPDVLEVPYTPKIQNSTIHNAQCTMHNAQFEYRLTGCTCLAGDIIGDYSFARPLKPGDKIVFEDMALYTMVKNNTFNGMPLPSIALLHENGEIETVKEFGYDDFKSRLS
jgi:carboxynorspermidine decarboxylase